VLGHDVSSLELDEPDSSSSLIMQWKMTWPRGQMIESIPVQSQAVRLALKIGIHPAQNAPHLRNRTNPNQFHSIGIAKDPKFFANPETQSLSNGLWNNNLEIRRECDGIHIPS
jgi:hypothetical protein